MVASIIAGFSRDLLHFFFPPICTICGERLTESDDVICDRCRQDMPRVTEPICQRCGNPAVRSGGESCAMCRKMKPAFDTARAAAVYAGPAEQLVRDLKYHERLELGPVMARILFVVWQQSLAFEEIDVVVPVPLHPARQRERGFNQAEAIARPFAELMEKPLVDDSVIRVRPTQTQTALKLPERLENVEGAFEPAPDAGDVLRDRAVVLIDDVCTTGATGHACAQALTKAGARRVTLFTFARALLAR